MKPTVPSKRKEKFIYKIREETSTEASDRNRRRCITLVSIPVLVAPCLTKEDPRSIIFMKKSKCETISPRVMIERFLNVSGINETAHQTAFDMLSGTDSLQS